MKASADLNLTTTKSSHLEPNGVHLTAQSPGHLRQGGRDLKELTLPDLLHKSWWVQTPSPCSGFARLLMWDSNRLRNRKSGNVRSRCFISSTRPPLLSLMLHLLCFASSDFSSTSSNASRRCISASPSSSARCR